ncbi:MAG: hypothetical protein WCJ29_06090 [bacterium]
MSSDHGLGEDEINLSRRAHEETLIRGGARKESNKSLLVTPEQIELAREEMKEDFRRRFGGKIDGCLKILSEYPLDEEKITEDLNIQTAHGLRIDVNQKGSPDFKFEMPAFRPVQVRISIPEEITDGQSLAEKIASDPKLSSLITEEDKVLIESAMKELDPPSSKQEVSVEFKGVRFVLKKNIGGTGGISLAGFIWEGIILNLPKGKRIHEVVSEESLRERFEKSRMFAMLDEGTKAKVMRRLMETSVGKPILEESKIESWRERVIDRAVAITEASSDSRRIIAQARRNAGIENLRAEPGDLIHGTVPSALEDILVRGINCNEVRDGKLDSYNSWAGSGGRTMETTFFADFWEVRPKKDGTVDFRSGFDPNWLTAHDNARIDLVIRRSEEATFSEDDIIRGYDYVEKGFRSVFYRFPEPEMAHACVFTGVESTEISGIVAGGQVDLEKLKEILVRRRRFIPIFDIAGNRIFDFEEFRTRIGI